MATAKEKEKAPKKARNKSEEREIREEQEIDVIGVGYRKMLAKAEKARDIAASEYWQTGFQNRHSKVEAALKRVQECLKGAKAKNYDTVKDVADIKKHVEGLRLAVEAKDLFCFDVKFDALELETFCKGHVIFRESAALEKTAKFNNELGIVEFSKNKF